MFTYEQFCVFVTSCDLTYWFMPELIHVQDFMNCCCAFLPGSASATWKQKLHNIVQNRTPTKQLLSWVNGTLASKQYDQRTDTYVGLTVC